MCRKARRPPADCQYRPDPVSTSSRGISSITRPASVASLATQVVGRTQTTSKRSTLASPPVEAPTPAKVSPESVSSVCLNTFSFGLSEMFVEMLCKVSSCWMRELCAKSGYTILFIFSMNCATYIHCSIRLFVCIRLFVPYPYVLFVVLFIETLVCNHVFRQPLRQKKVSLVSLSVLHREGL